MLSTLATLLALVTATEGPSAAAAVEAPALRFREVSEPWGLVFHHHHGGSGERYMVETMVGGVVIFDYDGDGDPDVFFVDGGRLPGYRGEEPRSRLFRNDGGRFVDVTDASGLEVSPYGCGAVSGDVDGDGDIDLYVTQLGENLLFENRGDGTFRDVTAAAGVGDPSWSTSATFFDPDRDGDLDLYVANYVAFTVESHKACGYADGSIHGYCHPDAYPGLPDTFYLNRGSSDGGPRFEDGTAAAGLGAASRAGLGVVAGDLDGDGWQDLYVANDQQPNLLFRNRATADRPAFEDLSLLSGTSHGEGGKAEAGMGVDLGDVDGDGLEDLVVTHFEIETNALYLNQGAGLFLDARYPKGVAAGSLDKLAFGVAFGDLDHDGDLDLVVANGHIQDQAAEINPRSRYAQRNQVYEYRGGRFQEAEGVGLSELRVSRGLALGDLDGDGDLDLVFTSSNDRAEVYENLGGSPAQAWLQVDLRSAGGTPHGVGARLEVTGAGEGAPRRQVREVRTGSSYLSQSSLTGHFGLGEAEAVDLAVRWPSGERQRLEGLPAGRRIVLFED